MEKDDKKKQVTRLNFGDCLKKIYSYLLKVEQSSHFNLLIKQDHIFQYSKKVAIKNQGYFIRRRFCSQRLN